MTPILNHYFARINWLGAAAANIDTLRIAPETQLHHSV